MKEEVIRRLTGLGYKYDETEDSFTIDFLIERCEMHIKNVCNLGDDENIPSRLHYVWVDLVCGEFLRQKRDSGKLTEWNGFSIDSEIGQIRLGDMFVTNGKWSSSPATKLNYIIEQLLDPERIKNELVGFRRVKW